uniref:hypothetical protein n=1 Tax=Gracilaria flabelliformis TaxID=172955 RepID=UPI001D0F54BD|nr:hypothetical protein LK224_mgp01 [Gracilaria flabelliformis]UAD89689.1 hypothetical protein [Gracilaria flabelliformis]
MNQFRLNNQSNFIEVFDSLDSNFSRRKSLLIFNTLNCIQVSCKFEKLSKIILPNNLFLECFLNQKLYFFRNQNFKKQKSLYFMATIRGYKVFLFLEILLHSIFLMHQFIINWHKIKISCLDLFWPSAVLDKLLMNNTALQNKFMIYVK